LSKRASHFLRGLVIDIDNDHNTKGTADRIAKMYLQEVFKGRYLPAPKVTDFPNAKGLDEVYTIGPITIRSACSHHFVPIIGRCWIGIIPGDRVIGISKFNRIVDWIASRPQIQEEMAMQIANYIEEQIQPKGLAVIIEATHMCMTWRGVKEPMESMMKNSIMRGVFRDKPEARAEFMALVSK
jgi:GTP cyclohydrolase I